MLVIVEVVVAVVIIIIIIIIIIMIILHKSTSITLYNGGLVSISLGSVSTFPNANT